MTAHCLIFLSRTSTATEAPDDMSVLPPLKKRRSRKKRKKKGRSEEAPPTEEAEIEDSNDSADEVFHDAQSDLPGVLSFCVLGFIMDAVVAIYRPCTIMMELG